MGKGTKGKDKKPGFPMAAMEVKSCEGDEQERKASVWQNILPLLKLSRKKNVHTGASMISGKGELIERQGNFISVKTGEK